ncbi:alcohol dehydrogenase [NADP(+)]-like isoform X2 [Zootermopsis nevadensis]|nr:alcohol dehydrogenase [NADP(+)]-like isoform X2 [Zootermopsis nevadensis]
MTKLPHIGNRASDVEMYLTTSLRRLQLDYVDLYLIHVPFGFVPDNTGENPAKNADGSFVLDDTDHLAVWKAMEQQVDSGHARSIGVSNFNISQLEKIVGAARICPATLQVELHAYLQQPELRACCSKLGIPLTAYSPLGSPGAKLHFQQKYNFQYPENNAPDLLEHPLVKQIGNIHGKSPAQVLLRHLVQQGIIVIPKSADPKRIKENGQIFDFELTPEEMLQLGGLDLGENGRIINFMFWKGVEKHPEYPFKQQESI